MIFVHLWSNTSTNTFHLHYQHFHLKSDRYHPFILPLTRVNIININILFNKQQQTPSKRIISSSLSTIPYNTFAFGRKSQHFFFFFFSSFLLFAFVLRLSFDSKSVFLHLLKKKLIGAEETFFLLINQIVVISNMEILEKFSSSNLE